MTVRVLMPEPSRLHSGYHAELTACPPDGVAYELTASVLYCPVEMVASEVRWRLYPLQRNGRARGDFDNIPYFTPPLVDEADLIHSHLHPVINDKPFVLDLDTFLFPWATPFPEFERIKRLEIPCTPRQVDRDRLNGLVQHLRKPNCRRILAWSPHVAKEIRRLVDDDEVHSKVEVLYPAVSARPSSPKRSGPVRIMFCGSAGGADSFIRKGGDDVFRLFEQLRSCYDIELCYVGAVPRELRTKLAERQSVVIHERLSKTELFAQYEQSHIFLFPSRLESFGMVSLEAMNHELPIVASTGDQFPSHEVLDHGRGAFLTPMVDRDVADEFHRSFGEALSAAPQTPSIDLARAADYLAKLIEQPELREAMGRYNKSQILHGRYSIQRRNRRLAEVYAEALSSG